ncbi:MAG: T9SS type A sorting domain-containing protein [Paludibacter sp.]|nr:T9SS type A sorting domain-containing protein [Bacteroidales bacterium]MCM1068778.1 T9SS type A sorting domain-containing protein [Prevotella sp.]MCM1354490.1 T9SS type A sorting domain-containing protein [Bacteroides sp.]MCM1443293.1 T9SS type A sorting domain-containing protein [Muribaculum sp.]MCM1481022.1 T9SS type A sorting domain-containing protein [Paludibacter sp.]
MKKSIRFCSIICFLLMNTYLQAEPLAGFCQTYISTYGYTPEEDHPKTLSFNKDTLINGITYYKAGNKRLVRTQESQIKLRTEDSPTEYILYDFALQPGDTMPQLYCIEGNYCNKLPTEITDMFPITDILPIDTVIAVSTIILYNGEQRKVFICRQRLCTPYYCRRHRQSVYGFFQCNTNMAHSDKQSYTSRNMHIYCPRTALPDVRTRTNLIRFKNDCHCRQEFPDTLEDLQATKTMLSPNPAQDYLRMEGEVDVKGMDMQGQVLRKSAGKEIDVRGLAKGAYIARIRLQNGTYKAELFLKE